jgi:hypothetical protein
MSKYGWIPGRGLGSSDKALIRPIEATPSESTAGVGFPSKKKRKLPTTGSTAHHRHHPNLSEGKRHKVEHKSKEELRISHSSNFVAGGVE